MSHAPRFVIRSDDPDAPDFERVVMAEVIVPDVPNTYADIYSPEAVKEFAYEYARQGYGIDQQHDQNDLPISDVFVCESFIARKGDPDFLEGSWVVGMKILSDDLWAKVLSGEINGYSIDALCSVLPVTVQNLRNRQIVGVTEPDPIDGHTHEYVIFVNALNHPISGGTAITNGHAHTITTHTRTGAAQNSLGRKHSHRFHVLTSEGES